MEDDESWLYGDDPPAEASADADIKIEAELDIKIEADDVSIFITLHLKKMGNVWKTPG
jgi:hypothetical protein